MSSGYEKDPSLPTNCGPFSPNCNLFFALQACSTIQPAQLLASTSTNCTRSVRTPPAVAWARMPRPGITRCIGGGLIPPIIAHHCSL